MVTGFPLATLGREFLGCCRVQQTFGLMPEVGDNDDDDEERLILYDTNHTIPNSTQLLPKQGLYLNNT